MELKNKLSHALYTFQNVVALISFLLLHLCSMELSAQLVISESFDESLEELDLIFFYPLESEFKYENAGKNRFFDYDLKMTSRSRAIDVFIMIHPEVNELDISLTPHVEFAMQIAHLASNSEEHTIWVQGFNESKTAKLGSDWASEARFVLKRGISRHPNARLLSFYKQGKGYISVLYCFTKNQKLPDFLSFEDLNSEIN